ncbi:MAG TPA: MFS transporter [Verrucomicrobiae bacterium]|jgi:MFS family permease|nr:MFS transporter [Verrucomicrobiae bacterium]
MTTNAITATVAPAATSASRTRAFQIAWGLAMCFYFLEYASRSAPAVMIPELTQAFGMTAVGVSAILGTYYYTYSVTSLIAGGALDRVGARKAIPIGIFVLAIGCLLFSLPTTTAAYTGRLLQGAGSAFAFTGAVYLAVHGFSARWLATAIGITQCVGMLGGSAGQFVVGPLLEKGLGWQTVWHWLGIASLAVGVILLLITPSETRPKAAASGRASLLAPYKVVFSNPQSYLCGAVAGLLFVPTTIGDMTWGVAFFQRDRMFSFHDAVVTGSLVPLGWVIGCPVLGWLADRVGRRKPVLIGGAIGMLLSAALISFTKTHEPAVVGCFLFGTFSGAAMIPYTIVKEVNPDEVKGSATGGINFLTFGVTALIGPLFADALGKGITTTNNHVTHFRDSGLFWMVSIAIAILLSVFLRETGPKRKMA